MDIESLFLQLKEYDIKKHRNLIDDCIKNNVKIFIINLLK
jgi:hypothetical protein